MFCQQCCLENKRLLSEAFTMVDDTKMSINKRNRDTPSGTRPVDVKPSQLSPEPTGYFGSTEEGRPLKKSVRMEVFSFPALKMEERMKILANLTAILGLSLARKTTT